MLRRIMATIAGKTVLGIVVPLVLVFGAFMTYSFLYRQARAYREASRSHAHHAEMLRQVLGETAHPKRGHEHARTVPRPPQAGNGSILLSLVR